MPVPDPAADNGINPVDSPTARASDASRYIQAIDVERACEGQVDAQVLMPVAGPGQNIDGRMAIALHDFVGAPHLDHRFLEVDTERSGRAADIA